MCWISTFKKSVRVLLLAILAPLLLSCDKAPPHTPESSNTKQTEIASNPEPVEPAKDPNVLRICYTNYSYMGGDEFPKKGAYPYIAVTVLERAGYQVEVDIINWSRCLEKAKDLEYDMVAAMWENEQLSIDFNYLNNSTIDEILFFTHKSSNINTGDITQLKGTTVTIIRDTGGLDELYSRENWFKVHKVRDQIQVINMLLSQRTDLIVAEPRQLSRLIKEQYPEQLDEVVPLLPALQLNYASPGVSKTHPRMLEIQQRYNDAYHELVAEGLYQELAEVFGVEFKARQ